MLIQKLSAAAQAGVLCALFAAGLCSAATPTRREPAPSPVPQLEKAQWIWGRLEDSSVQMRKVVTLGEKPDASTISITADNGYELFVNGSRVGADKGADSTVWQSVERYDIASRLARGKNVIGIQGTDLGGVRGVIAALRI